MILLPTIIFSSVDMLTYSILLIGNLIIHFIIDHLKANVHILNLIQDQLIHLIQIVLTWIILF